MDILRTEDLCYSSKGNNILSNFNLEIRKGDFVSITGPSGSGKSTLLKLINNLITPSSGYILYKGENILSYEPVELRKNIRLCFQMPFLFGETVYDNLSFPFITRKMQPDKNLMSEMSNLFNLEDDFLYRDIRNLSGGEKQRISIARTLLFEPDILLLDEVTSALDENNTLKVEEVITDFNNRGVTVLWVTHNSAQAKRIGHRNIHIENGHTVEVIS